MYNVKIYLSADSKRNPEVRVIFAVKKIRLFFTEYTSQRDTTC